MLRQTLATEPKGTVMAAHADHHTAEPITITLVVALASVIGFAAGIVVVLGRLIGPEHH